jgi:hypothetical protein
MPVNQGEIVDTNEWPSERQELSIVEALKLINGKCDDPTYIDKDLIYKAAIGELTIYVLTDNWSAQYIYDIEKSKVVSDWKLRFTAPEHPPFPDSKDREEYKRQTQAQVNWPGVQEVIYGNRTGYGRKGAHEDLYGLRMSGYKPIAAETFKRFYEGDVSSKIELNLSKSLELKDNTKEYFFCPDPEVLLQDAIKNDKLFVMKADLLRVFPNEASATDDAKTKVAASKKTIKGPRPATLVRYADWQRRADEKIKKNPALSAYAVAEAIRTDLESEDSKNIRSVDAIRQHIKI